MQQPETLYSPHAMMNSMGPVSPLAKSAQVDVSSLYSPIDNNSASKTSNTTARKPFAKNRDTLFRFTLLCFTLCAPPIVLICWALKVFRTQHLDFWLSAPIGGQFSQIVAKGIDFLCGAIIAPLIMATVNLAWFSFARSVNPGHQTSASLKSFLEMSTTSCGSYEPWKLWNLVRSKSPRFRFFALLVLFAAITTSLFVNVIAYEGFVINQPFFGNATLRYISNPYPSYILDNANSLVQNPFKLSKREQAMLAVEYTTTMNNVAFGLYPQDYGQLWQPGQFISANTTKKALDGLPGNIKELQNVPAFRQTMFCEPANISTFTVLANTPKTLSISVGANSTSTRPDDNTMFVSMLPGTLDQINSPATAQNYLTLFSMIRARPKVFLGVVSRSMGNRSSDQLDGQFVESEFGNLPTTMFLPNQTFLGQSLTDTKIYNYGAYQVHGIICELHRQNGLANLVLDNNSTQTWNVTSSVFDEKSVAVPDRLFHFQSAYQYRTPLEEVRAGLSGMGTALGSQALPEDSSFAGQEVNMSTFANNFLYAAGMVESIVFNIALLNSTRTSPEYSVNGLHEVLKYRMTYIPGILILGLIGLTTCAALVLGMTLHSWKAARSLWAGQMVDGLRFVADFAPAMKEVEGLANINVEDRANLEKWGTETNLVYVVEDGRQCLRLRKDIEGFKV